MNSNKKNWLIYLVVIILVMLTLSYASVPLYRVFCQMTGFGGTTQIVDYVPPIINGEIPQRMLTIKFNADVASGMPWKFHPTQNEIKVLVGESALAFYEAYNPSDQSIIGISTYNVVPQQAGIYFNKIQCFCFEEQLLKSKESIDMPVFFFIDNDFLDDPKMDGIDTITLSYTFFSANDYNLNQLKSI